MHIHKKKQNKTEQEITKNKFETEEERNVKTNVS